MTDPEVKTGEESRRERHRRLQPVLQPTHRHTFRAAWLTRVASVGLCLASLVFVVSFAAVFGISGLPALVTPTPLMRLALALPYVVMLLTIATAIGTGIAWRRSSWSLWARLHQTVVAVLGIAFVWQLFALGFLP